MKLPLMIVAGVTLFLAGCSEPPAGEAVTKIRFDGKQVDEPLSTPSATAAPTGPSACKAVEFEGAALTHCIADPSQHTIAMANLGADKQPFGSLGALAASMDPETVAFAVNGGMYGDDLKPIGYYVQNGERLHELNRANGDGNFYMKPNGVFFGSASKWQVLGSNTFFNTIGDRPQFGTQSGPLILIDGKLHPEIQDDGPSKAIRNGVGVDAEGLAHFVISDVPVSFGQLARYFRDVVKVGNALYLDGQVSSLWDPARGRIDKGRVGPIIVVSKRAAASATPATAPSPATKAEAP